MLAHGSGALITTATLIAISTTRFVLRAVCKLSPTTPNEVYPFLLKVDMDAVYGTFHPDVEKQFRETLPAAEFKRIQWQRIHLALHYCKHIANNSRVFLYWSQYEGKQNWPTGDVDEIRSTIKQLRVACLQSRLSTCLVRFRLQWWLFQMALLPFVEPPSFATLIAHGGWDMISFYEKVTGLAESLSLAYGSEYHKKIMQAL